MHLIKFNKKPISLDASRNNSYNIRYFIVLVTLILIWHSHLLAQDKSPTITGEIEVSVKKGTITCDLSIKDMPQVIGHYALRINSGMNIRSFTDLKSGKLLDYDLDTTNNQFESKSYYFQVDRDENNFLKTGIRCQYTGMFPVIDSLSGFNFSDWRGNVAFTKKTLRVDGLQAAWYPVLYDVKNQHRFEEVNYDVQVKCADCKMIYINGDTPKNGPIGNFKSTSPKEMLLFCGDYKVQYRDNISFLNAEMSPIALTNFSDIVKRFKEYYQKKLDIPYNGKMTFIQTAPTASANHAFKFFAYPTIVQIGVDRWTLKNTFRGDNGDLDKAIIAHELGHYYFGTILSTNTAFGPLIDEGFAEFLSYKVMENLVSKRYYDKDIMEKARTLRSFKPLPLSQIKTSSNLNSREFYTRIFMPELLVALEKELGQDVVWSWLHIMLTTPTKLTDYDFFKSTFYKAVGNDNKADEFAKKYFESPSAPQNVMNTVLNN